MCTIIDTLHCGAFPFFGISYSHCSVEMKPAEAHTQDRASKPETDPTLAPTNIWIVKTTLALYLGLSSGICLVLVLENSEV